MPRVAIVPRRGTLAALATTSPGPQPFCTRDPWGSPRLIGGVEPLPLLTLRVVEPGRQMTCL